jgi:hypothetical protein
MRFEDYRTITLIGGRFLDRPDRRDGVRKSAVRRCTIERTLNGDTSMILQGGFAGFIKGTWDTGEPSHPGPMDLNTPAVRW